MLQNSPQHIRKVSQVAQEHILQIRQLKTKHFSHKKNYLSIPIEDLIMHEEFAEEYELIQESWKNQNLEIKNSIIYPPKK